eukprot:scaffold7998_cov417-Prasinococcus_capsulatus_cf.AAC.1
MPASKSAPFWLKVKSGLSLAHERIQGNTGRLQKQELTKGLELALQDKSVQGRVWAVHFQLQLLMIEWKSVGNSSVLEECIHPEVERIAKEVDVLNKTLEGVKSLILVADGKPHEAMILLKAAATGSETRNETEGTTSGSRRVDCFVRTVEALVHLARGEMQLACEQAESLKGLLYADDSADGPVCFRWITPVAFDTLLVCEYCPAGRARCVHSYRGCVASRRFWLFAVGVLKHRKRHSQRWKLRIALLLTGARFSSRRQASMQDRPGSSPSA